MVLEIGELVDPADRRYGRALDPLRTDQLPLPDCGWTERTGDEYVHGTETTRYLSAKTIDESWNTTARPLAMARPGAHAAAGDVTTHFSDARVEIT